MGVALITGPTAGIGRAIAEQLAARGHPLILVARDETRLRSLAADLPTRCEVLVADLSDRSQVAAVEQAAQGVQWLVNNAGYGLGRPFPTTSVDDQQRMLDVLVTAPMRLTHAALPTMVASGHGRVLNVSSIAGWLPNGTYSAAKAWLTNFSEGLAASTPGDVHVTALCPGLTRTEFHQRAGLTVALPGWMWLSADDVARQGIEDCDKGIAVSVPGYQYRALSLAVRHTPRRLLRRGVTRA